MIGPLFSLEMLRGSRRDRLTTLRRCYAGWLAVELVFLVLVWSSRAEAAPFAPPADVGRSVHAFLDLLVIQHFLLLTLATPAVAAGAITEEKTRGTLPNLLTTDLTAWDIVAGKLVGRLTHVTLLALPGLPVFCLLGGFVHLPLAAVLALGVVSGTVLFALGSAGLLASVRRRQTSDALVRVYAVLGAGALSVGGLSWWVANALGSIPPGSTPPVWLPRTRAILDSLNPFAVLETIEAGAGGADLIGQVLASALTWGLIGAGCLGLAVWRLRPEARREFALARRARYILARPARAIPENDPVQWREAELVGAGFLPGLHGAPPWMGKGLVAFATLVLSFAIRQNAAALELFFCQGLFVCLLASLVAGIRAAGTVAGERERQTWDLLLLTPLHTWEILWGKLDAIRETIHPYLWVYAVVAVGVALTHGVAAVWATAAPVVLTWSGVYFMAATGLWYSVRSPSTGYSLLVTLVAGYGTMLGLIIGISGLFLGLLCVFPPLGLLVFAGGIPLSRLFLNAVYGVILVLILAWLLSRYAHGNMEKAVAWVETQDRSGKTFLRALVRAIRRHAERVERQATEA